MNIFIIITLCIMFGYSTGIYLPQSANTSPTSEEVNQSNETQRSGYFPIIILIKDTDNTDKLNIGAYDEEGEEQTQRTRRDFPVSPFIDKIPSNSNSGDKSSSAVKPPAASRT